MKKKLYIIGIGPGDQSLMSLKALDCIKKSEIIIGYKTYINLLDKKLLNKKTVISSGMKQEINRCKNAINLAKKGKIVSIISSGDSGIYGMASLVLELLVPENDKIDFEIIPGITSCIGSASLLGAPISNDFAVISLSNLLTDWELIKKRLKHACIADFVIALYNPKSNARTSQIIEAQKILIKYKNKNTPVGIVDNGYRPGEKITITTLNEMLNNKINMTTTVIIGNSKTYIKNNKIITPRGYSL